jgi:hypothetical protein
VDALHDAFRLLHDELQIFAGGFLLLFLELSELLLVLRLSLLLL